MIELPVISVRKLIVAANFDWVDQGNIVTSVLPADIDESVTSILLRDASSEGLAMHGDNMPHALAARVEVQIFFKKDLDVNPLGCKLLAMNMLSQNGWLVDTDRPLSADPDTGQFTATFYVKKKIIY
ncbi:DUF806 family protein [Lactobacillus delbrueckii]|uniref:DUF806 family protein n=1 Tax=Lactobacillus phage G2-Guo TaxID=3155564 RepID=A0AAU7PFY9_9VIRU|nr:DUF806 family protein [Lactobacillus delbrueckii]MCD5529278.1 DUF806 family protein [Lactobacillus delbrueckii subsp. lactis]MCS8608166.1 DUF806 family protein [Lactobacillus delbrueckii subsp. lactis]UNL39273.1 DUF806 family protein [Lactobacillus delbrueckii]